MNASKEEAKKAREGVEEVLNRIGRGSLNYDCLLPVLEFLHSAERKLPTEAAYERERKRKRTAKGGEANA